MPHRDGWRYVLSGMATPEHFDAVVIGAGVSSSFIAHALTAAGMRCVCLEAGRAFTRETYPRTELDGNALLYWGGGLELNSDATIGLLRPKAVGGGSIVNQALVDRFDDLAFDSWRDFSGIDWLTRQNLDPYYDRAAEHLSIQAVPQEYANGNARVFREGFAANGYRWAPLSRAQRDCRFADGNCCIECLNGCRIDSKQSTPVTVLARASEAGLTLVPEFEVTRVEERDGGVVVSGVGTDGPAIYRGGLAVLGAGAIGNSRLLLASGFGARLPALGHNFWTHPQFMNLGVYDEPIGAHRGPLQSYKSDDPGFRRNGFKLENVFAPPVAVAMLLPGFGRRHQRRMREITHFACIEVAVRDTNPGRIRLGKHGEAIVEKRLNGEDERRRRLGLEAIRNIFLSTGAREIVEGDIAVGLHLMGGCNLGVDPARSVTSPEFRLHGTRRLWAADSSVFPTAPGINPSYTIMAMSLRAADQILQDARA